MLAVLVTAAAGGAAMYNAFLPARAVLQGYAVLDPFSSWLTVMVCLGTVLAVLLSSGFLKHRNAERGEFYALVLFAAAGMSLLGLSAEFITLFINLEVLSIATYALTAFLRRGPRPSEAGFKYFILGAFAGALLLYGAALLYGATGATKLVEVSQNLPGAFATSPGLVYAGLGLVLVGFAFKVAAVPFHMWTPDVYEGAPTPVTALMSAGVKAAAFVAMVRTFVLLVKGIDPTIAFQVFSALALLTMVGGNLMALPQRNVKRMLAYSSIAHAGYLLLGVAALFAPATATGQGLLATTPLLGATSGVAPAVYKGLLFYLLGYTVTSLGASSASRGWRSASPAGRWPWRPSCCRSAACPRRWGSWASCSSSAPLSTRASSASPSSASSRVWWACTSTCASSCTCTCAPPPPTQPRRFATGRPRWPWWRRPSPSCCWACCLAP
jgi:NADH-quinone oxidoreductase subunit N